MTPRTPPAALVEEEYAVEIKTVSAVTLSVAPKTSTVQNTVALMDTPAGGNASGKKRKRVDTSEDEVWPVPFTEYHGQRRAIKRACVLMPTITEEC